jgi:methyl-accepting chemotaxis protein
MTRFTAQPAEANGALDALRIRSALDNVSANVMLADADNRIVYVNRALQRLLERIGPQLRHDLPGFEPADIVGQSMDQFALPQTWSLRLQIVAEPVLDASGQSVGTVVEWVDRTQECRIEEEIAQIVAAAHRGDLLKRIRSDDKQGFFSALALGINRLLDTMQQLVRQMKGPAAAIQRHAQAISEGNLELSRRTGRTAATLEETAASMEQMTSSVRQTADNAGQANQLALAARQQAEKGGVVVGNAIAAMSGINQASKKIADIIGVIDEIAFQTNLLALNAAVEAARAGEQGRGFAVVATEVRSLAGRSATAAKEIKALIQDSVARVDEGSRLVDQSGSTLSEIVSAVEKVTDIVAEIAAASREQASGIEQVNKAVIEMDATTQQNAALVAQATTVSGAIVEHAAALNGMISPTTVVRTERRAPGRPWSAAEVADKANKADKSAPSKPPPVRRAVSRQVAADSDWQEF